jgi:hypothetical protein
MADMDAGDGGGGGAAARGSPREDVDSDTAAAQELADLDEEELLDLECELAALMDEQLEELPAAAAPGAAAPAAVPAANATAVAHLVRVPGQAGSTGGADG